MLHASSWPLCRGEPMSNGDALKPRLSGCGPGASRLLILLPLLTVMGPSCLLAQDEGHIGIPTDWSHRHMVFSAPRSPREALHLSENPRYLQQWLRRNIERRPSRHPLHRDLNADWSESMGTGATVAAGQYPAKFSFSATTASCAKDFVVFNTSLAGATGRQVLSPITICTSDAPEPSPRCTGRMIRAAQLALRRLFPSTATKWLSCKRRLGLRHW